MPPFLIPLWAVLKPIFAVIGNIKITLNGFAIIGIVALCWVWGEHKAGETVRAIRAAEEKAIARKNAEIDVVLKVLGGEIAMDDQRVAELSAELRKLMLPDVKVVSFPVPAQCKMSDVDRVREKKIRAVLDQINVGKK